MIVNFFDTLRRNLSLLAWLGLGFLALLLLWDVLWLDKSYVHIAAERMPGFWTLFGFASATVIIGLAKIIGGLLQTDEDYYDK